MGLQQELDAVRIEFVKKLPDRAELYNAKVEELRHTFPVGAALKVGDRVPDFTLPDARGQSVSLSERLREGPVAVIFYRGGWCPFCNLQLRAYQRALDTTGTLGCRLLAISPQMPDASLSTAEANGIGFDVLSDAGNAVARSFGIAYVVAPEVQATLEANGKALPAINGDDSWELPLTASYVIAMDRTIMLADIELDYRRRLEPKAILTALHSLQPDKAAE